MKSAEENAAEEDGAEGNIAESGVVGNTAAENAADAMDQLQRKNHALAVSLERAGTELRKLKTQLAHLGKPPVSFATFIKLDSYFIGDDDVRVATAQILYHSRRLMVAVSPSVDVRRLRAGDQVLLNENMQLVGTRDELGSGSIRFVEETLGSSRLLVSDSSSQLSVVRRAQGLEDVSLESGDRLRLDASGTYAVELLEDHETSEMVLEEVPKVSFSDIGGLDDQIQAVRDAVELPFLHRDLFEKYGLAAPKGVLLYGPPGNGKTLIAKAVAHSLIESAGGEGSEGVFLSVKGPEILNKYVGESERLIRSIFKRARTKATAGIPVVVFIDEMDSLLRIRGTGISSDVENTIVPQFLAELDGIESLTNVIVIGASNRVDMIDPAVLRPGRLDVKIRIGRPGPQQAASILHHYVTDDLPLSHASADELVSAAVDSIFARTPRRLICDVQTEEGAWSPVYFADLISGAALKNIADRAKTKAVKSAIAGAASAENATSVPEAPGITLGNMAESVMPEFYDTRGSVSGLSPQQWSSVQGLERGRIVAVRPAPVVSPDTVTAE
ncbi:MAG: proteasome ATPase [Bifidobacteriaceae bacterium]|jgi:proteasome-associated ATPase|nr:proteasome ATPase [Bifidobacteriaceae bacterium]